MLYNYHHHISTLRKCEKKSGIIRNYEINVGPIGIKPLINNIDFTTGLEILGSGEEFYNLFIRRFPRYSNYLVQENLDFDWALFLQLVGSSLSSEHRLLYNKNGSPTLQISVSRNSKNVYKKVEDLYGFQIYKLFELYVEENIMLYTRYSMDEFEMTTILSAKSHQLKLYKESLISAMRMEYI